ncbi:hypothetical protein TGPRC2_308010 [Toxoplasma gondii TgCatPRC2]|uniref:Uncharacterized protein n=1 Tax=Toxoplasma gondii TgCatPRC2 TaxID=1130821 RepID=A0A151GZP7_TOXGO|nr:hypothetical protein TGPRC2_308010 [Toxoplasma gondii TgCatPRC2]
MTATPPLPKNWAARGGLGAAERGFPPSLPSSQLCAVSSNLPSRLSSPAGSPPPSSCPSPAAWSSVQRHVSPTLARRTVSLASSLLPSSSPRPSAPSISLRPARSSSFSLPPLPGACLPRQQLEAAGPHEGHPEREKRRDSKGTRSENSKGTPRDSAALQDLQREDRRERGACLVSASAFREAERQLETGEVHQKAKAAKAAKGVLEVETRERNQLQRSSEVLQEKRARRRGDGQVSAFSLSDGLPLNEEVKLQFLKLTEGYASSHTRLVPKTSEVNALAPGKATKALEPSPFASPFSARLEDDDKSTGVPSPTLSERLSSVSSEKDDARHSLSSLLSQDGQDPNHGSPSSAGLSSFSHPSSSSSSSSSSSLASSPHRWNASVPHASWRLFEAPSLRDPPFPVDPAAREEASSPSMERVVSSPRSLSPSELSRHESAAWRRGERVSHGASSLACASATASGASASHLAAPANFVGLARTGQTLQARLLLNLQKKREDEEEEMFQLTERHAREAAALRQQVAALKKALKEQQSQEESRLSFLQERERQLASALQEKERALERERQRREEKETLEAQLRETEQRLGEKDWAAKLEKRNLEATWRKKLMEERQAFKSEVEKLLQAKRELETSRRRLSSHVKSLTHFGWAPPVSEKMKDKEEKRKKKETGNVEKETAEQPPSSARAEDSSQTLGSGELKQTSTFEEFEKRSVSSSSLRREPGEENAEQESQKQEEETGLKDGEENAKRPFSSEATATWEKPPSHKEGGEREDQRGAANAREGESELTHFSFASVEGKNPFRLGAQLGESIVSPACASARVSLAKATEDCLAHSSESWQGQLPSPEQGGPAESKHRSRENIAETEGGKAERKQLAEEGAALEGRGRAMNCNFVESVACDRTLSEGDARGVAGQVKLSPAMSLADEVFLAELAAQKGVAEEADKNSEEELAGQGGESAKEKWGENSCGKTSSGEDSQEKSEEVSGSRASALEAESESFSPFVSASVCKCSDEGCVATETDLPERKDKRASPGGGLLEEVLTEGTTCVPTGNEEKEGLLESAFPLTVAVSVFQEGRDPCVDLEARDSERENSETVEEAPSDVEKVEAGAGADPAASSLSCPHRIRSLMAFARLPFAWLCPRRRRAKEDADVGGGRSSGHAPQVTLQPDADALGLREEEEIDETTCLVPCRTETVALKHLADWV